MEAIIRWDPTVPVFCDDPICSWPRVQLLTNIVNSRFYWFSLTYVSFIYRIYIDKSFSTRRMLFQTIFWPKENTNESHNRIVRNWRYLAIHFLNKVSNFPEDLYLDPQTIELLRYIEWFNILQIYERDCNYLYS